MGGSPFCMGMNRSSLSRHSSYRSRSLVHMASNSLKSDTIHLRDNATAHRWAHQKPGSTPCIFT